MKVSFIAASLLSLAVAGSASPALSTRTDKSIDDAAKSCNANQVVACCNPSSTQSSAGLLSAIVGPILGNGCTGVSATVLAILSGNGATAVCGNTNTVKCCNGNKQTGLVNVDLSCTDVL
ncbi:hypothetical protein BFW01_g7464 [Lasiodiplodia theobromae]|uniref:Hydrophobin n=1 Tax=Lasiodiplodia theobromae TaxID=45133 RepID=A0A5N5D1V0_9PEZI|nr:hemagglutinin [Lasiodiplodia theobromae]KAB2571616.1 Fruiting body protein SC4 [Lasiodiplodia theobromae]KAF4539177.1 hemagglutinin [Lasiodiplodia theobromae]KAF9636568.1 hypothetical protein BFW01_g7464 [Lasiodiplodia theobromae]